MSVLGGFLPSYMFFYHHAVTTDVQDVTICQVNRTSFTVSCVFLDGSNDNCEYALTGMDSITGAIDSSNSEGETVVIDNIDGRQLQAHDSDLMLLGDDSGLIVTRNITGGSVEPCSVSTTGEPCTTTANCKLQNSSDQAGPMSLCGWDFDPPTNQCLINTQSMVTNC